MSASVHLLTPFGASLHVRSDGDALVACDFSTTRAATAAPRDPVLREAAAQVRAYCAKRLRRFDVPLRLNGTPLAVAIWRLVASLETGETISYADVARAVGSPGAHRAVAAAMRRAPFDLFIPAHRVIGSDGRIKGAGPASMRRRLLAFEGIVIRE